MWRERSDFIIAADISAQEIGASREQLWARQVAESQFELCCIPFFVDDMALGDVVETEDRRDGKFIIRRVIKPSGRYVFRVWILDTESSRDRIVIQLQRAGALIEASSLRLISVDAKNQKYAQKIADILDTHEREGTIIYETGKHE
ncbi:DUF4265 domain-containing protein [Acidipropionibacterium jensenii]|nr:DUF4265 domain-containing protein [Acidipropionibacterium jensenii]